MTYFVYILQSDSGAYYTGQTNDLDRPLHQHQQGRVQSTKLKTGRTLVHTEEYATRIEAVQREREIKSRKSATLY